MDENKEKLNGGQDTDTQPDELQQEMEDLARIFKEELDKSKKEAEESLAIKDLEVDGYNPQTVSKETKIEKKVE